MLKLLCAPLTADLHGEIRRKIKTATENNKRTFLIVPEQQTVLAEGDLSEYLHPSSALTFEVTNFTRFANTTFRALGGISGEACDKTKRRLIMWRTLTELSCVLSMTENGRDINAGMVDSALSAVDEMQSHGISADMLQTAASDSLKQNHRRLYSKISDLSKIYALFKKLLGKKYSDSGDEIELAARKLKLSLDFLRDSEIYIEGFTSFTEPQYEMITSLADRACVTVALSISKARPDAFEYTETRTALEKLKSLARREGIDIKLSKIDGRRIPQSEEISSLVDLIWQKNNSSDNNCLQNSGNIRIIEAKTPFDECDFICEDIKRLVMRGAHYSDFAIVFGSASDISKSLETSLTRHDMPAFLSRTSDASSFEAIKLIYTAYSVVLSGYRREDVLTYAKCGLSGISREACDEFELYVNTWQISGKRFTDPDIWNMNPLGYTTTRREGTDEKLLRIHETRKKLITPLMTFADSLKASVTVRDHAEALYVFLHDLGLESSLRSRAELLSALGEKEFSEDNLRLWKIICDSLDTLVEVSSELETTPEAFLGQLKIIFSSTGIGRIPAHRDEITVGSADMLRLYEKKHVYLIGVNAGSFPAPPADRSFFSEKDKLILSESGLTLPPELESRNAREMFVFIRAISYANQSITFSYSRCDSKFKSSEPSSVISRIGELVSGLSVTRLSAFSTEDRLWFSEDALGISEASSPDVYPAIKDALVRSGYEKKLKISESPIVGGAAALSDSIRLELYGKNLNLTETRINSFTSCPMSYFCKYVLKLSEQKTATLDASGIGSFIHSILESFVKTVSERDTAQSPISADERNTLTRRAAKDYIRALGEDTVTENALTKIKIDRLCRAALPVVDALCDELVKSKFRPRFFELPIGKPGCPDSIRLHLDDESTVRVYGVIDRVDSYTDEGKTYLRVIDYKTGKKDFSPEDLERGENLQMFLYLRSLIESSDPDFRASLGLRPGEKAIPAGVIYVKTSVADVRVDHPDDELALAAAKSSVEREGMVLSDESVLSAMGLEFTPVFSPRTPDTVAASKRDLLFDEKGWEVLSNKVEQSLKSVAMKMRSGDVSAHPTKNKYGDTHCKWCEFKPICRAAIID